MRPGQIQVFDGLRLTTEHLDHFQGSLHSAIQDIRGILGLGRVFSGFEVAAGEGGTVTVQPGVAFDFRKNRIVSDEPKSVPVTFADATDTAYVCVKYDQIEDRPVEGRFTIIWDDVSFEVRAAPPAVADNLVPLAKVMRTADGALEVTAYELEDAGTADDTAPQTAANTLNVKQGVQRLPEDPAAGAYPAAAFAQELRSALESADAGTAGAPLVIALASTELAAGFDATTLTCYVTWSATIEATAASPAPAEETPPAPTARTRVVANGSATGEITRDGDDVAQFGSSTWAGKVRIDADGIACLPLASAAPVNPSDPGVHDSVAKLLRALELTLRVSIEGERLKIVCALECTGPFDILLQTLEEHGPRLTWDSRVAWKAFGQPHPGSSPPQPPPTN